MGAVNFSVDLKLVQLLQNELKLTTFVETGTFKGETIISVSPFFKKCLTVELSKECYIKAAERFIGLKNVIIENDDSASFLKKNQNVLSQEKVCYWLDAHWCVADKTAGELSQCPLLNELEAIKSIQPESVILIDDARLYLCAPPRPHEISHWPSLGEILSKLNSLSKNHQPMILNDVIIFYPRQIDAALRTYAYNESIDFLKVLDKSRDYDKLMVQLLEKENLINELDRHNKELDRKLSEVKNSWQHKPFKWLRRRFS